MIGRLGLIGLAMAAAFFTKVVAFAEQVEVHGLTGTEHSIESVPGWLYLPDEPREPKVGVVYLHGCSGPDSAAAQWNIQFWADWYNERGIAFLALDSHRPRSVSAACTAPLPYEVAVQRPLDAIAGHRFMVENAYADPDRIFVHGLSQGGRTVLNALKEDRAEEERFAGGIAFYPYCPTGRYRPYAPVIILIGGRDAWTPAERCEVMVRRSAGADPGVQLLVYPGATHSFDFNFRETTNRYGYSVGQHPAAFADSRMRVENFITKTLRQ